MHLCAHTHAHILSLLTHNSKQGIILHRLLVEGLVQETAVVEKWWLCPGG